MTEEDDDARLEAIDMLCRRSGPSILDIVTVTKPMAARAEASMKRNSDLAFRFFPGFGPRLQEPSE